MDKKLKKIISFVIDKRMVFIAIFLIMAIGSIFLFSKVNVNYDTTEYLEDGSITRKTLELMDSEFKSNGSFQVMVEDVEIEEAIAIKKTIASIEGVSSVVFDENDTSYYQEKYALYGIYLVDSNFTSEAKETVLLVKDALKDYHIYLNGSAVESQFLGDAVEENMVQILLWACIIVLIILLLNSISWVEPLIFMIVIFVAIIINMGTNAFLPSISFVTQSICAVMQLALAMDYSIMLLHQYMSERELDVTSSDVDIVKRSLRKSIVPILGSSLTTIAGLLALVCMKFKMGMDIGLVLAKGIVISLLVVFFFMPGILIVFSKLIKKTKHRNIYQLVKTKFPRFEKGIAKYQYKSRFFAIIILGVLIVVGFTFYLQTEYAYTLEASNDPKSTINLDNDKISSIFGSQNSVAILVPHGDINKQSELISYLEEYSYNNEDVFTSVQGISSTHIYDYYTYSELANSYNIPSDIVKGVYLEIDENANTETKMQLEQVLNYLVDSDYIIKYASAINNKVELINKYVSILNDVVNVELLEQMITDINGSSLLSKNNCQALLDELQEQGVDLSTITYQELIDYIVTNDIINTILNTYKDYCQAANELKNKAYTKNEVMTLFTLSQEDVDEMYNDSATLLLNDIITSISENRYDTHFTENEVNRYNYYLYVKRTMDVELNKSNAIIYDDFYYKVLPSSIFLVVYGMDLMGNKKLTNYDIQNKIISNNLITSNLEKASDTLKETNDLIELLDVKLTSSELASVLEIDEALISTIFDKLGITISYGRDILKLIESENIVEKFATEATSTLKEAVEMIKYAKSMFESEKYDRIVLNMQYKRSSLESAEVTKNLRADLVSYYSEYYVASESSAFIDFEETFTSDSIKINLISFLFILIIIALSFRSLSIPVILTVIIQGAIWLTMTISVIEKSSVYFICYLMVVCIQMGTTIDYGILYTSKYIENRKIKNKQQSLEAAFSSSITTILTSGSILVVAAFVVGKISQVSIISSIGYLLSKGSLISVVFILMALPQVLVTSDKFLEKTTSNFILFDESKTTNNI